LLAGGREGRAATVKPSSQRLLRILLAAFAIALPIASAEFFLRTRFAETPFVPGSRLLKVQSYLRLHPTLGFLWKGDIAYDDGVLLPWRDQVVVPLSTDSAGFRNHPRAIAALEGKRQVDVIGLGDSFLHDCAYIFHDLFEQSGFFYYNMAMHRHSPPQYNLILEQYAAALRPRWVVYAVFENDFREAVDFERWKASGIDWFSYHSGTWAGPPVDASRLGRLMRRSFRGGYGFYRSLTRDSRQRREGLSWQIPAELRSYVLEASEIARSRGIRLLLVLVPSKTTAIQGSSDESLLYDQLLRDLREAAIPTLDLRQSFAESDRDPASLYYRLDAHWNPDGMRAAGEAILARIMNDPG
jgi:hypothetical protein